MLDIQSMILAQRVMLLKIFADEENRSFWKTILDYFISPIGGNFILKVIPWYCTAHPVLRITQRRPRSYSGMAKRRYGQISRLSSGFFVPQVSTDISKQNNVSI